MADRLYASIAIGGRVTRDGAEALAEVMADEGLGYGASILFAMLNGTDPKLEEDTEFGWLDHGVLHAAAHEVNWGEFDCVEAKCLELGLTYVRQSEGKYDISPEIVWSAGDGKVESCLTDHECRPMVNAASVAKAMHEASAMAEDAIDELALLTHALRELLPDIPVVPPLEIVEGEPSQ
jgi:hypothetical protein